MESMELVIERRPNGAAVFDKNRNLIGTIYSDYLDTYYLPKEIYHYRNHELAQIKAYCDKLILEKNK